MDSGIMGRMRPRLVAVLFRSLSNNVCYKGDKIWRHDIVAFRRDTAGLAITSGLTKSKVDSGLKAALSTSYLHPFFIGNLLS